MKNLKTTYSKNKEQAQEIEIPLLQIMQSFDKSIGDDSPENIMALEIKMAQPFFKVADTGISSKNLLGWKNSGVLLEFMKREIGWTRFNFTELIWLYAVRELREIGVGLSIIKKIKDELIYPYEINQEALKHYAVEEYKDEKEYENMTAEKLQSICDLHVFLSTVGAFTNVLQESIVRRVNMQLVVIKNGDAYFYEEGERELFKRYNYNGNERYVNETTMNIEVLRFKSHVTISFTELIKHYILNSKDALIVSELGLMTLEERELFELIKRKNIQQITIKYKNESISLIEVKEQLKVVDLESRYCDHILKRGYQTIEYVTENGKMVSFARTTKIKN
ncbi:MAG: MerR family transcriptional regulator [Bacteroidota bacterium]